MSSSSKLYDCPISQLSPHSFFGPHLVFFSNNIMHTSDCCGFIHFWQYVFITRVSPSCWRWPFNTCVRGYHRSSGGCSGCPCGWISCSCCFTDCMESEEYKGIHRYALRTVVHISLCGMPVQMCMHVNVCVYLNVQSNTTYLSCCRCTNVSS